MSLTRRVSIYNLVAAAILILPLLVVIGVSVNPGQYSVFPPDGFSLRWFSNAFGNHQFLDALRLSLEIALGATAISLALAVPASLSLVRWRFRGRSLVRVLAIGPLAVPEILLGLGLLIFFTNALPLGAGTVPIVLGHALVGTPIALQVLTANLTQIDGVLEEAAQTLGAPPITAFTKVTLPLMVPGMVGAGLLSFIFSFDNVNISLFLTTPGESTLPVQMYSYLNYRSDPTVAAMSTALVLFGLVFFVVANRVGALRFMASGGGR
ncbi:MAG TPA: ABC transporter permease [Rugosimonospora sp.]|jgi:putative spermidine/putrescine transport system permease protein